MKNLRFVCAQPAIKYYTWQVEVMLNNFRDMGVNLNNVDVVSRIENNHVPEEWTKLAEGYPARFFFYSDTRDTNHYISSIRPNLLKQHWAARPEILGQTIFYHDCDIAFTRPIHEWLTQEMIDDDIWYGSDTRWYISHSYIMGKGADILQAMCDIVQIHPQVVQDNELNSIGAQYMFKGIDASFWEDVERDCEKLFKDITALSQRKKARDPTYHELQIWCADMWAVLWNGWKRGHQTRCHPALEFSWATGSLEEFNRCNIFHNAGVTNDKGGLFYKALFMDKYPYNQNLDVNPNTGSGHYYRIIQEVGNRSVLL